MLGGEPKNTVGLVTSTSFLDKLKLDSEGDCSFKPEISRGAEISQDFFLGVDFSKKLKSWSPW
jgi:hypothetical protein